MAIPVISKARPGEYELILEAWHANPESNIIDLERERFGYDHSAVGALMAESWGLPETLIHALASHHDLSPSSAADPAVRLVSLLKYYEDDAGPALLAEIAQKEFAIHTHLIEEMLGKAFSDAQEFARLFD